MNPLVHPMQAYNATFVKTENLTSFMQKDAFVMDLGYIKHAEYAFRYTISKEYPDK